MHPDRIAKIKKQNYLAQISSGIIKRPKISRADLAVGIGKLSEQSREMVALGIYDLAEDGDAENHREAP
jgi:hypothetical protein